MSETLWDALHRMTDPQPAKEAASLPRHELLTRVLEVLVRHGAQSAAEIHRHLADPAVEKNSVSRRLTTLERKGYAQRMGTKRGACGVDVTVWAATADGRRAVLS